MVADGSVISALPSNKMRVPASKRKLTTGSTTTSPSAVSVSTPSFPRRNAILSPSASLKATVPVARPLRDRGGQRLCPPRAP